MRLMIAILLLASATLWAGAASANHDGMFDLAALQERPAATAAPAEDSWLGQLRSWLTTHLAGQ